MCAAVTRLPVCLAVMAFNTVLAFPLMDTWLRFDTGNVNFVYFNLLSLTLFSVLLLGQFVRQAVVLEEGREAQKMVEEEGAHSEG